MTRLGKLNEFLEEVSRTPRLKFDLAWLTFGCLVVPAALLMSFGFPERYVLPLMLVAILPFQYGTVCVLRKVQSARERAKSRPDEFSLFVKRMLDVLGAAALLVLEAPLMLLMALLIKLDSPGPILYRMRRCGLGGRLFVLYKFRTLTAYEEESGLMPSELVSTFVLRIHSDPRVTRVGRWLRRLHLDESPQLWNVLKGDMSFVGPRPPFPEEVERYEPWQYRQLRMRPGLICTWAFEGWGRMSFEQWMNLDLAYMDNWSLGIDVKILLKLIWLLVSGRLETLTAPALMADPRGMFTSISLGLLSLIILLFLGREALDYIF